MTQIEVPLGGFVVHKYALVIGSPNLISLPIESKAIHVGEQEGVPTIWYQKPLQGNINTPRAIHVIGTGQLIMGIPKGCHIGSVQMFDGFVWHLYEEVNND